MSTDRKKELWAQRKRIREFYPISGLAEGWYFKIHEDPDGSYVVQGRDIHGRTVWRTTSNPKKTLAECVEYARSTTGDKNT